MLSEQGVVCACEVGFCCNWTRHLLRICIVLDLATTKFQQEFILNGDAETKLQNLYIAFIWLNDANSQVSDDTQSRGSSVRTNQESAHA